MSDRQKQIREEKIYNLKEEIKEDEYDIKHMNNAIDALDAIDNDYATKLWHEKKGIEKELARKKVDLKRLRRIK